MTAPTYVDATTAQTQTQIRAGLLASLAANGSAIGGLPVSSPDRGLVEAESAQLALEQSARAAVAQSSNITDAVSAGDTWVDACATWFQVSNGAGGFGRIQATAAVWSVGLVVAPSAAPVTLQPGQQLQVQATDPAHSVFNLSILSAVTLNSGSSYKASVQVTARLVGAVAGNVAPSALQAAQIISSGVAGLTVDASVLPVLVSPARDQESSPELRDRCLASWGRLGAGWTRQAFDYLIPLFSPATTQWNVRDDNPYGPGTVGVVLGDSGGVAAVSAGLNGAATRPLGSGGATVTQAASHTLVVTAFLAHDTSRSDLAVHDDGLAVLALLQRVFPIGGVLEPSLVISLLRGDAVGAVSVIMYYGAAKTFSIDAPGFASVTAVTLTGPAASTVFLAWNEKLVITPAISP